MAPMSTSTHRLRLGLEDLLEQPLRTVPVEIAPGADSLEVRLRYDRRQATVDLGCEGPAGWRGWSGGARDHFVIAAGTATPATSPVRSNPGCGTSSWVCISCRSNRSTSMWR